MQIHQLSTKHNRKSRRVGRGGKRGTYSGRGIKGQKSRAGARIRPAIYELIKMIPKLRGVPSSRFKKLGPKNRKAQYVIVDIQRVEKNFKDGEIVSPASLMEKKLINRVGGRIPNVKILSNGALKNKFKFEGVEMSKNARAQINNLKST